jgi:hypothetical protein
MRKCSYLFLRNSKDECIKTNIKHGRDVMRNLISLLISVVAASLFVGTALAEPVYTESAGAIKVEIDEQYTMIKVPLVVSDYSLNNTDDTVSVGEMLRQNLYGSISSDSACQVHRAIDSVPNWDIGYLYDSEGDTPSLDGKWLNVTDDLISTMTMSSMEGYWLYSPDTSTTLYPVMTGWVNMSDTESILLVEDYNVLDSHKFTSGSFS